ncbi:hypothetical protein [Pseudomonas huanghezhanensis]|uniref:hypothetical protein n=1 Tax=Pseudomonas huanghezhanensis TaxID=3002903 RepID=UPI0022863B7C|nr:hypothetical protein [Pseudomonas sp. BSw22131]
MHEDEKQQLEQQLHVDAFKEAMFKKIASQNLAYDGERFENKTVQLVFEAYLEGAKPNPARVIGQQLYAEIKPTSKYASQIGWMEMRNGYPFPVRFEHDPLDYIVKGGVGGYYRLEDVELLFKRDGEFYRIQ